MKRKRGKEQVDFFATEPFEVPMYGTGDAAEILEIPMWRLQKFLDSPQYNLSPTGNLGEGRGSRRLFSTEDLHRVALANWLIRDGFAPQFVGEVLQRIEDSELSPHHGPEGEEVDLTLAFYRGKDGPVPRVVAARPSRGGGQNPPYYYIEFAKVFGPVNKRIASRSAHRSA